MKLDLSIKKLTAAIDAYTSGTAEAALILAGVQNVNVSQPQSLQRHHDHRYSKCR